MKSKLTLTEIWTVIGAVGIHPYYDSDYRLWRFIWQDPSGEKVYGSGPNIGKAAEDFVSCFLNR